MSRHHSLVASRRGSNHGTQWWNHYIVAMMCRRESDASVQAEVPSCWQPRNTSGPDRSRISRALRVGKRRRLNELDCRRRDEIQAGSSAARWAMQSGSATWSCFTMGNDWWNSLQVATHLVR